MKDFKYKFLSNFFIIILILIMLSSSFPDNMFILFLGMIVLFSIIVLGVIEYTDKHYESPLIETHSVLINHYQEMIKKRYSTLDENCKIEIDKINEMLNVLETNLKVFPDDKTSRWLGYIQAKIIDCGITTVNAERNFSRKYFHNAYQKMFGKIPKTITIGENNEEQNDN